MKHRGFTIGCFSLVDAFNFQISVSLAPLPNVVLTFCRNLLSPSSKSFSTLKMVAGSSLVMSIHMYRTSSHHIPKDCSTGYTQKNGAISKGNKKFVNLQGHNVHRQQWQLSKFLVLYQHFASHAYCRAMGHINFLLTFEIAPFLCVCPVLSHAHIYQNLKLQLPN
jgi:hypothetical protein